uniref:Uncharacterized protein n=1 Tax=Nelumbo nucifera TaxID=4432 RepID=A0A822Y0G3_NELNU|nr:TPA_asm: hypothetical protein HUJ06_026455 [Nelumbo nucifera]
MFIARSFVPIHSIKSGNQRIVGTDLVVKCEFTTVANGDSEMRFQENQNLVPGKVAPRESDGGILNCEIVRIHFHSP